MVEIMVEIMAVAVMLDLDSVIKLELAQVMLGILQVVEDKEVERVSEETTVRELVVEEIQEAHVQLRMIVLILAIIQYVKITNVTTHNTLAQAVITVANMINVVTIMTVLILVNQLQVLILVLV